MESEIEEGESMAKQSSGATTPKSREDDAVVNVSILGLWQLSSWLLAKVLLRSDKRGRGRPWSQVWVSEEG